MRAGGDVPRSRRGLEISPRRRDGDRNFPFCTLFSLFPEPPAGCRRCPPRISAGQRLAPARALAEAVRKSENSCPYLPRKRDSLPRPTSGALTAGRSRRAGRHRVVPPAASPAASTRSAVRNPLRHAVPRPTAPSAHSRRFPHERPRDRQGRSRIAAAFRAIAAPPAPRRLNSRARPTGRRPAAPGGWRRAAERFARGGEIGTGIRTFVRSFRRFPRLRQGTEIALSAKPQVNGSRPRGHRRRQCAKVENPVPISLASGILCPGLHQARRPGPAACRNPPTRLPPAATAHATCPRPQPAPLRSSASGAMFAEARAYGAIGTASISQIL